MRDLNQAIYERLSGVEILAGGGAQAQASLKSLLAPDALSGRPAVFSGNMSDTGVIYPCITYRANAGVRDPGIGSVYEVDRLVYDFEIWSNSRSVSIVSQIENNMSSLLDERRQIAPPLMIDGYVFMGECFVPLVMMYNREFHAWYGILRYQFVASR